jgi:hypothetical protein
VNPKKFFAELKRRNVYKVAIAYGVVAWLLMQVASQIFPFFDIPNWAVRLVVLLLVIGFPGGGRTGSVLTFDTKRCIIGDGDWKRASTIPFPTVGRSISSSS